MSEGHNCGHDHAHHSGQPSCAAHTHNKDQVEACSCCDTDSEAKNKAQAKLSLRQDAGVILRRADQFLSAGQIEDTHSMLSAAETLLDNFGGHDCPEGVWMFTTAGMLCTRENDSESAERWFHKAHQLALAVHGEQHPVTGMVLANLGEIMAKNGNVPEGIEHLTRAISELKAAVPTEGFPADTIANVIAYKQSVLDQLSDATPAADKSGSGKDD